jgi:hypothetical protein
VLAIASACGFPTLGAILLGGFLNRRRHRVDTAEVIEGAALRIAGRLDVDVEKLQRKVDDLTERLDRTLERAHAAEADYARCQQIVVRLSEEVERARLTVLRLVEEARAAAAEGRTQRDG